MANVTPDDASHVVAPKSPCGHDVSLYETTGSRRLPIMLGAYPGQDGCRLWCNPCCHWQFIFKHQYDEIRNYFGGAC